jgi:hypothetical protein
MFPDYINRSGWDTGSQFDFGSPVMAADVLQSAPTLPPLPGKPIFPKKGWRRFWEEDAWRKARLEDKVAKLTAKEAGYASIFSRAGWTSRETGLRSLRGIRAFNPLWAASIGILQAPFYIAGTAVSTSAEWGTKSGYKEDYVGGFVAGAYSGLGENTGMILGEQFGVMLGSPLGPVGAIIGGVAGMVGGGIAGKFFLKRYAYERGRMASLITAGGLAKRKVQFGRGFRDTEEAYTMRQLAIQEMSGSLLSARQYLGNEAAFQHR